MHERLSCIHQQENANREGPKMRFTSLLLILLLGFVVFSGSAFGQAIGSMTGVVSDVSQAKIPGVSVTAINTATGVRTSTISNETGAYNFPSLAVGPYQLEAALTGFRTARVANIDLRSNETLRYNLTMEIGSVGTSVAVTIDAQELLAVSSSSVGQALSQDQVSALPLIGGDVLDLINTLPGFRLGAGIPGANNDTMAGAASSTINTVRDGLSVTDGRFPNGAFATTVLNPDMVGEVRMILTPVDAEMGRGNGQVQITTRSGTNRYTGSAVWNIRNSALNANTWDRNNDIDPKTGLWKPTVPDWQNQNQLTFSYGGPIIKNKTFFFGLFDKNLVKTRALVNGLVLTDTARQGIFRYFEGWTPTNAEATPGTSSRPSVDFAGNPLFAGNPGSRLICFSVFGTQKVNPDTFQMSPFGPADCPDGTAYFPPGGLSYWDAGRPAADTTGFMKNFLALMPHANRFGGGDPPPGGVRADGLNTAQISWTRNQLNQGINSASAYGGDQNIERTQFNIKVDHNFSERHKANIGYSVERDNEGTNFSDWPDNPHGLTRRAPWVLTSSFTSSLSASMINEARFGIRYNVLNEYNPWENPDKAMADTAKKFFLQGGGGYPAVFNPALLSLANSPYNNGDYNGNRTPLYSFGDTLSWTRGTHAFKFGGEVRLTKSVAYNAVGGTPLPTLTGGAGANVATSISTTSGGLPGLITTANTGAQDQARSLLYFFNGSINQGSQLYWINDASDVQNGNWENYNTLEKKYRDQVTNEADIFVKDDWKISKSLTLNLGLRWEYYGVPFIGSGFTTAAPGLGLGLFGVGRTVLGSTNPFDKWLVTPGNTYLNGYGPSGLLQCNAGQASGVAGIPASNCDPSLITTVEFVGPNSPNPNKTVYPNDYNNFGPAVGFAWQPAFGGEGKTTIRGGYQMTFGGAGRGGSGAESYLGGAPGATSNATIDFSALGNPYLNLNNVSTIVPIKPTNPAVPGGSLGTPYSRSLTYTAFDPNYTTPYIENFTLSLTRQIHRNITLDLRYAGTQAKKQIGLGFFGQNTINLNTSNVYHNPELFNALETVRSGGEAPIFDQMFAGMNLNSTTTGYTAIGTTNSAGVVQTGSLHLRRRFATQFAQGDYITIANFINSNTGGSPTAGLLPPQAVPNLGGRILRNGCDRLANGQTTVGPAIPTPLRCFPEDYLVANPQFATANYNANTGSSNYHSLETQISARPIQGVSVQGTYTWAKSMELPGIGWTDPLDRDADYRLATNHRGQEFRMNGTFDLPVGPNKLVMGNSSGALARIVEGWRLSWTANIFSGAPATIGAQSMLYGNGTPDVVGPWNVNGGQVHWGENIGGQGLGGTYFGPVGTYKVVTDPACAPGGLLDTTDMMGFNIRTGVTNGCPLTAIADSSNTIVLQNPAPGKRGTLGQQTIIGPGSWTMDGSLSKQFRISESKSVQLRFDATNVMNHPQPNNPQYSINNSAFGTIAAKGNQTRVFQGQFRFNF
jgi:hypothetical protein